MQHVLADSRADFAWFCNSTGKVLRIWPATYKGETSAQPISRGQISSAIGELVNWRQTPSGLLRLSDRNVIFAHHLIGGSDGEKQPAGYLWLGSYLDKCFDEDMAAFVGGTVVLLADNDLPKGIPDANTESYRLWSKGEEPY